MISRVFINRPRLAVVVSVFITLAGLIAMLNISVAQYPRITPPVIRVNAFYPGANAEVLAKSVATTIESEVNGVENMLYMSSSSSNTGAYSLSVTFEVGTDTDIAQVNLQNRIQAALAKLPQEVVDQGVTVRKGSSDILGAISFFSPQGTRDKLFLSNYVGSTIKDAVIRIEGVSDINIFGELEYSMRVWMNPDRMTALSITADDLITAIRQQNVQAAVGSIGAEPVSRDQQLQYTLRASGRLQSVEEFENIIIRTNAKGGQVRVKDVARVELGAESYSTRSILNGGPAVTLAVYASPSANALATMQRVGAELEKLAEHQPSGVEYQAIYDSTKYIAAAIHEMVWTLFLTFLLVVAVTFVFLQDWRATLVPTVTIPVSLIGTFAVLLALGYNANTISLFALIMSIGLVVDDAIVVVENVYRVMHDDGLKPKEAALKAMGQVTGPIIATTLVLLAVFIPVGFLPGITGQLYKQFAVTICTAVVISAINALTLSPALCAVLLKKPQPVRFWPLVWFNKALHVSRKGYVAGSAWLIRWKVIALMLLLAVIGTSYALFLERPTSFLPQEDQGLIYLNIQLPEAATINRTDGVLKQATEALRQIEGINSVLGVSGFSLLSGRGDNVGFGLVILAPWDERRGPGMHVEGILKKAQQKLSAISTANIRAFTPPPIRGLGRTGGFDFQLQTLEEKTPQEFVAAAQALVMAANQNPVLSRVFSTYTADTPQLSLDIDRNRVEALKVPLSSIFSTLQAQLGGRYVNDFNLANRGYQVKVQADSQYRDAENDISRLYVRNGFGKMVPLSSLVSVSTQLGPQTVDRYNQLNSIKINGNAAAGYSSGQAMTAMEQVAAQTLPPGYTFDWSGISYQERKSSGQVTILFALALLFAYLFLVGQYESWNIPLSIIISVPVATLGALVGLWVTGSSLSIYAQIGLVLLVGLASKNAILIVEFAQSRREDGLTIAEAAVDGGRIRFRPVLMTSFTFIFGLVPMVIATGAGAGSRQAIGITVFSGMLSTTLFGIFLIPVLYYLFQSAREKGSAWRQRLRNRGES
ncbi:MAG: multidrug efflux RND transporter permease subunit [Desulfuromonadales bacterium]|nr:multidrug efflux RND transporter permease subunit [Desulfuromonadales bacterium]MBN2792848.1 multidrug efflux RND transporter permease subunit [Desulfuromonadales bacterium]